MNAYNGLTTLKDRLDVTGTAHDTALLALLVAASREIDDLTNRFFYVDATTRYFDGAGVVIFLDDLLSVTTFKLDEDGDATYEVTMAVTDYVLYPLNEPTKVYAKISSNSNYGGFASGVRKGVEIAGDFGFGNSATPYSDSGVNVPAGNLAKGATSVILGTGEGAKFSAGNTIRIDTEQIYVSVVLVETLTLVRGVNGTIDAAHTAPADIDIYGYPEPIMEATLIQAMRWWKRRETAFQDVTGLPELGTVIQYKGLDPDVKLIVEAYRKRNG